MAGLVLAIPATAFAQDPHPMPMPHDTVSRDTVRHDTTHAKRDSMPGMAMPESSMPGMAMPSSASSASAPHAMGDMQRGMQNMRAMMTLPLGVPQ